MCLTKGKGHLPRRKQNKNKNKNKNRRETTNPVLFGDGFRRDLDAVAMADAGPDAGRDLDGQLPALEALVDQPQADDELFAVEGLCVGRGDQVPDLFQHVRGKPAALPDVLDHDVDDQLAGAVEVDVLEIAVDQDAAVAGPHAFVALAFPFRHFVAPPLPVALVMHVGMPSPVSSATLGDSFVLVLLLGRRVAQRVSHGPWWRWVELGRLGSRVEAKGVFAMSSAIEQADGFGSPPRFGGRWFCRWRMHA